MVEQRVTGAWLSVSPSRGGDRPVTAGKFTNEIIERFQGDRVYEATRRLRIAFSGLPLSYSWLLIAPITNLLCVVKQKYDISKLQLYSDPRFANLCFVKKTEHSNLTLVFGIKLLKLISCLKICELYVLC